MKKNFRFLKASLSPLLGFLVPGLIVIFLFIYSYLSSEKPINTLPSEKLINTLLGFSLTDLILVGLAIYAISQKPWRENLAGHFKKAYQTKLKSIQKIVKERNSLREECNTFSVHQRSFASLESMTEAMLEEEGYPAVDDTAKMSWDFKKEDILKGLDDIENIKNSNEAAQILANYASMVDIDTSLLKETIQLRELKSLSKTGEIRGTVMFTNEFAEDFPKSPRFHNSIRLKPVYIRDSRYVSQFWIGQNLFYPNDPDTGKKAKKRNLYRDDNWWLLSMSSPYWKYVLSITLNLENICHRLSDGRSVYMPPKDFQLPDGNNLLDLKGKTLFPIKTEKDGIKC